MNPIFLNNSITEELVVPESLSTISCVFKSALFYTECISSGRDEIAAMGVEFGPGVRVGAFQKGPMESRMKRRNGGLPVRVLAEDPHTIRLEGGGARRSKLTSSYWSGCANRLRAVFMLIASSQASTTREFRLKLVEPAAKFDHYIQIHLCLPFE